MSTTNPLFNDQDVNFLLYDILQAEKLCELPAFQDHSREIFDMYLDMARKFAREDLYPAFKPMDADAPKLVDGEVKVHPVMHELYPKMAELGLLTASRPPEVGGAELPLTISNIANGYLMAANASAFGYPGLTLGAARLIEAFGTDELKEKYMAPMYEGRFTGTMALTEPQAGSSLSDVATKAVATEDGHYLLSGTKIFLSGGDQDFSENIVHLTLARIEGAPIGIKGISLFAVPKRRISEDGVLVRNDVTTSGVFHKVGWKGLPSIALSLGEKNDCHGYLVGEAHQGIRYMFQMMNEARLLVGMNGVATSYVAYLESLNYARERPQGRPIQSKDPGQAQIPIIEHADVRRMLLKQKAIVEGGLCLLGISARYADLEVHSTSEEERKHANLMLDLLIPVAKSFPAERGFESNALAVQIHGGYGYTNEYPVEAWLREQKLNSIHEGTTGIHSLDLLGRKVMMKGGAAMRAFHQEVTRDLETALANGVPKVWCDALLQALTVTEQLTVHLGQKGQQGDVDAMLLHSAHYLELFSTLTMSWIWIKQASAASKKDGDFYRGKMQAAQYWMNSELPRVMQLAQLCESGEDSYANMKESWF
ncbi:MAG: acyl-CoA dehydrogenase [Myxococcota bacterium]|nr:acyl-CoA dehydrogenase [Myxococcota bacterium]